MSNATVQLGDTVVCTNGALAGTDPFTALVVDVLHDDGTLDVSDDKGREWLAVAPTDLTIVGR